MYVHTTMQIDIVLQEQSCGSGAIVVDFCCVMDTFKEAALTYVENGIDMKS